MIVNIIAKSDNIRLPRVSIRFIVNFDFVFIKINVATYLNFESSTSLGCIKNYLGLHKNNSIFGLLRLVSFMVHITTEKPKYQGFFLYLSLYLRHWLSFRPVVKIIKSNELLCVYFSCYKRYILIVNKLFFYLSSITKASLEV